MIKVVLCDDEKKQRNTIKKYLDEICKEVNIEYVLLEFESGEKLLKEYPSDIDLAILDIQMDRLNGMDTAREIRKFDTNVDIIFITADSSFMQDGYEVRAYRYLLKPVRYYDLKKHISACINEVENKKSKYITIKENNNREIVRVPVSKICYIETENRYLSIHTDKQIYTTRVNISKIEDELKEFKFYRCHRCYLVNLEKIKSITSGGVMINDKEILVSRDKMKELKVKLPKMLGDIL